MVRSNRNRRSNVGAKIFLTAGLLLLLAGIATFASVIHLQLQWKQFQLQLAMCTYDVGTEEGYLKATSDTEVVRVVHKNASSVFNMVQTAKAASISKLREEPQKQILLEYSCGAEGALSLKQDGTVHIALTDVNGKRWNFQLGKCNYSSLEMLLSVEGAAVENAPWVD